MSKVKTVRPKRDLEGKEEIRLERFRLVFHHEYQLGEDTVKIDKPASIEYVMPLGERFGILSYNYQEIVRVLSEKLIIHILDMGSGENEII